MADEAVDAKHDRQHTLWLAKATIETQENLGPLDSIGIERVEAFDIGAASEPASEAADAAKVVMLKRQAADASA